MIGDRLLGDVRAGAGVLERITASILVRLLRVLFRAKRRDYRRMVSVGDLLVDRREKAEFLGFGRGSTVYDSALVIGDVRVGEDTWIGPGVILDGSGGLTIGSHCSISAGVQIYTHDSVAWAISGGESYDYGPTTIGDNCYIGPNTVIPKGTTIGSGSVIGACSFVNQDIPPRSKAFGVPVRIVRLEEAGSVGSAPDPGHLSDP